MSKKKLEKGTVYEPLEFIQELFSKIESLEDRVKSLEETEARHEQTIAKLKTGLPQLNYDN